MNANAGSSRAVSAVALSVGAISVATVLALLVRSHRKRASRSDQPEPTAATVPDGCQKLVLQPIDIYAGFSSFPIPVGSTTFYIGDDLAACEKHLRARFRAVVKANPWMV
jgi:hypothetical protein